MSGADGPEAGATTEPPPPPPEAAADAPQAAAEGAPSKTARPEVSPADRKRMLKDMLDQTFPAKRSAYEILNEIGAGASSIVYKVQCKELVWRCEACRRLSLDGGGAAVPWTCTRVPTHRLCGSILDGVELAVKEVNMDLILAPFEEVQREILLLRSLRHENIIEYYTSFSHAVEDDKGNEVLLIWLVMQLMEYGSVLDVTKHRLKNMRGERPPVEDVFISTILRGVLRALKYLHDRQLIHRDMKAGNILLGASGDVRVADFGVSGWLPGNLFQVPTDDDSQDAKPPPLIRRMMGMQKKAKGDVKLQKKTTFVGTPNWMAPEVLEMKDGYDCQADVWSLGITAIELGIGEAPYAEMEPLKVMVRTLDHPPPTLESLSKERQIRMGPVVSTDRALRDFVSKCLQKDPARRSTVAQLLKHDFIRKSDRSKQLAAEIVKWKAERADRDSLDDVEPQEWDLAREFIERELAKVPDVTVMNKPTTSAIPNRIRGGSVGQIVSAWVYTNTESAKPAKATPTEAVADDAHAAGATPPAAPNPPEDPTNMGSTPSEPAAQDAAATPQIPTAAVIPPTTNPVNTPQGEGSGAAAAANNDVVPAEPQHAVPMTVPPQRGIVKMALRIEDPNTKGKVVDISFVYNFDTDTAEGIVKELCDGGFIGILDAGQVALFLSKILKDTSCDSVTFPLHTIKSELPQGDDGTTHQEKLKAGFAQLIRKPVEPIDQAPAVL